MTTPKKGKGKRGSAAAKPAAKRIKAAPSRSRARAAAPAPVRPANRSKPKPAIPTPPPDVVPPRDDKGRFPPGVSGNLGGRPKRAPITTAYLALLGEVVPNDPQGRTYAEVIALATIREAVKGKIEALRELTDRVEGKARQAVELTGRDGGPIDVANLTPEQRDIEIERLAAEFGYSKEP